MADPWPRVRKKPSHSRIPLIPSAYPDLRYADRPVVSDGMCEPGRIYLLDMSARPTVRLDTAFDNLRLYISQSTIDELAYEKGLRRVGGACAADRWRTRPDHVPFGANFGSYLGAPGVGERPVSRPSRHSPSRACRDRLRRRERIGSAARGRPRAVADAPNPRLRRGEPRSKPVDLGPRSRVRSFREPFHPAFKQTMGMSPHQWCLRRRVERARVHAAEYGVEPGHDCFKLWLL